MASLHAEIGLMVAILVGAWVAKVVGVALYVLWSRRRTDRHPQGRPGGGGRCTCCKPTPAHVIATLPVLPYAKAAKELGCRCRLEAGAEQQQQQQQQASSSGGEPCAICFEEFADDDDVKQLPCRHFYHCGCIDKWLSRDNSCPLCKGTVWCPPPPHDSDAGHQQGDGGGAEDGAGAAGSEGAAGATGSSRGPLPAQAGALEQAHQEGCPAAGDRGGLQQVVVEQPRAGGSSGPQQQ